MFRPAPKAFSSELSRVRIPTVEYIMLTKVETIGDQKGVKNVRSKRTDLRKDKTKKYLG